MNSNGDIQVQSRFLTWLENYWYHYKWRTIGAAFLAVVLIICVTQCCSREKTDVVVLYAGPYLYSGAEAEEVRAELNRVLPADYNGDGEKHTGLVTYQVMTDEQLTAYKELVGSVDTSYFSSQASNCSYYIMSGECAVLLIDESRFRSLQEGDRLRDLTEVFPELPASAIDKNGIDFTKTALYRNSEQLGKLPEGTVLCLLRPYVFGGSGDKTAYAQMTAMFAAMARD